MIKKDSIYLFHAFFSQSQEALSDNLIAAMGRPPSKQSGGSKKNQDLVKDAIKIRIVYSKL